MTMLSRTADSLYWSARYMERAENTARILTGLYHMTLLPTRVGPVKSVWKGLFQSDQELDAFMAGYGALTLKTVLTYMVLDRNNASSIFCCIRAARENIRATRHVVTTELWETINQTWLEISDVKYEDISDRGHKEFLEWVKERSHLFRGVIHGTMRRGEAFNFSRLGAYVERAENTVRLLSAQSESFSNSRGGTLKTSDLDAVDYYQWGTLLRSVNAYKSYREVYKSRIDPKRVAELMVLNQDLPRSLAACVEQICIILARLKPDAPCRKQAEDLRTRLRAAKMDRIMRTGIRRFLEEFRGNIHALSLQMQRDFLMLR